MNRLLANIGQVLPLQRRFPLSYATRPPTSRVYRDSALCIEMNGSRAMILSLWIILLFTKRIPGTKRTTDEPMLPPTTHHMQATRAVPITSSMFPVLLSRLPAHRALIRC